MRLRDRVALITGAASGIGRATALRFAAEGAKVVVADVNPEGGEAAAREAGGAFCRADVTRAEDVRAMIAFAVARFGRLDILFNNAGIAHPFTPLEEFPDDLFDRVVAINVRGVYLGIKHAIPVMKRQGGGVILSTASTAAIRPRPGLTAYNATKGAVVVLTKSAAIELAPHKIRVNCICPVASDTPLLQEIVRGRDEAEARKALVATIPLGRLNRPEDVAGAALFLASDEAAMVTGIALEVDGGRDI